MEQLKKVSKGYPDYDSFLVDLMKAINPQNKPSVDYFTFAHGLINVMKTGLGYQELYTILRSHEHNDDFRLDV